MVGASNAFNQVIEKDLDLLMDRTKNRPLPSGRITKQNAFILGCVLTILGLAILYNVNPKTAMFGAISIFMYVSLYTPLKTLTPLSVFVGAFPGAIPLCWVGWRQQVNSELKQERYLLFNSSGNFHIFGPSVGSCMTITKRLGSLCCQQENAIKKQHFKRFYIRFG